MVPAERVLKLVLRLAAVMLLTALVPAIMPFHWMELIHEKMGMGKLPDALIVHYLTRSCSLMYALHGAILLFISFDVRRYLPFLIFQSWLSMGFGASMLALDLSIGMSVGWTIGEGPFIIGLGLLILLLTRRLRYKLPENNLNAFR